MILFNNSFYLVVMDKIFCFKVGGTNQTEDYLYLENCYIIELYL
jgi:hypothetical protein